MARNNGKRMAMLLVTVAALLLLEVVPHEAVSAAVPPADAPPADAPPADAPPSDPDACFKDCFTEYQYASWAYSVCREKCGLPGDYFTCVQKCFPGCVFSFFSPACIFGCMGKCAISLDLPDGAAISEGKFAEAVVDPTASRKTLKAAKSC